ncbi:MAG: hypothetical protein ABI068_00105 [Ktedonobacterales bacterium]
MVDDLNAVFEQAGQQPEAAQRDLARRIHEWLAEQEEERAWDAIISSPQGQETLERLAAEAGRAIAEGKTYYSLYPRL